MSPMQSDGYMATPSAGDGSPVLVLHAWWGLNDTIKAFCERLAEAGFVAYAPDLYHGKVTNQIAEAEKLVNELDGKFDQVRVDLTNAVALLKAHTGSGDSGMAVIGFSLGAFYALDLSTTHPETIDSVVLFYGTGPADFSQSKADYLGHFAQIDEFEPQENVEWLEESLKQAKRPATFYTYPGTGHWFFEPDRQAAYNAAAASLAWDRTIAFLKRRADSQG